MQNFVILFIFLILNQEYICVQLQNKSFLTQDNVSIFKTIKLNEKEKIRMKQIDEITQNDPIDYTLTDEQLNNLTNDDEKLEKTIGKKNLKYIDSVLDVFGQKWKNKLMNALQSASLLNYNRDVSFQEIEQFFKDKDSIQQQNQQIDYNQQLYSSATQQEVSDTLDFIEQNYNIDITKVLQENFDDFTNKMRHNPSLDELSSFYRYHEKQNIGLEDDEVFISAGTLKDEMYKPKKVGADDALPKPNTMQGGAPCINEASCKAYAKTQEKCTMIRQVLQIVYESINPIEYSLGLVIQKLCVCKDKKGKPFYYVGEDEYSCSNKSSYPGMACTIPFQFFLALYQACFAMWKVLEGMTLACKLPVGPMQFQSP